MRIGYFDQKLSELDEEHSLIDEIRTVRGDFNEDVARNFLGRFRFTGDDGFKKVKGLSGGERNRLTLAKMMLRPRNLLALDEPTNHLDIPAREVLEEALDDYEGTVIVVSHDRYFLDRVVTKIVHVHDGRAEEHVGNYSEWKSAPQKRPSSRPSSAKAEPASRQPDRRPEPENGRTSPTPKSERIDEREQKKAQAARARRRSRSGCRSWRTKIAGAESEIAALNEKLAADHGGDWTKLHALVADKEKIEQRLQVVDGRVGAAGLELSWTADGL